MWTAFCGRGVARLKLCRVVAWGATVGGGGRVVAVARVVALHLLLFSQQGATVKEVPYSARITRQLQAYNYLKLTIAAPSSGPGAGVPGSRCG